MEKLEIFGIKSNKIIGWNDNVYNIFKESMISEGMILQDGDIIAITSKVFSMQENARAVLDEITPSKRAEELANKSKLDPRFTQLVLDESNDNVYGAVYKAILAKTDYGLLANAGIDQSNSPSGYVLLLPSNPDGLARKFRKQILEDFSVDCAILIIDSRTIPLKRGTTAVTIGIDGMEPIIDDRGRKDLYGYTMTITSRAVADNVATSVNLLMGETDEQMPFGVIRGLKYNKAEQQDIKNTLMPETQCLYFGPLLEIINKNK